MVYGREIDGETVTFGTTGYTFNNVFVLYDRKTDAIWYPLDDGGLDAIGGNRHGDKIPFIEKPPVETLGEWLGKHPDSQVLLDDAGNLETNPTPEDTNDEKTS